MIFIYLFILNEWNTQKYIFYIIEKISLMHLIKPNLSDPNDSIYGY